MNNTESKYDEYGVLKTQPWPDIKKGGKVGYITTTLVGEGKRKRSVKKILLGIWDGEKVQFNDKEKTIVRTTRWLLDKSNWYN